MTNGAPCYKCPDRHEACWGHCDKYQAWLALVHRQKKKDRTASEIHTFALEQARKRKKHHHIK